MANALKTYTRKERNYYLLGLTGQNIIYNVIGVGLALYYTDCLLYTSSSPPSKLRVELAKSSNSASELPSRLNWIFIWPWIHPVKQIAHKIMISINMATLDLFNYPPTSSYFLRVLN